MTLLFTQHTVEKTTTISPKRLAHSPLHSRLKNTKQFRIERKKMQGGLVKTIPRCVERQYLNISS